MKESQFRRIRKILAANKDMGERSGNIYEWGHRATDDLAVLADELEAEGKKKIEQAGGIRRLANEMAEELQFIPLRSREELED